MLLEKVIFETAEFTSEGAATYESVLTTYARVRTADVNDASLGAVSFDESITRIQCTWSRAMKQWHNVVDFFTFRDTRYRIVNRERSSNKFIAFSGEVTA